MIIKVMKLKLSRKKYQETINKKSREKLKRIRILKLKRTEEAQSSERRKCKS